MARYNPYLLFGGTEDLLVLLLSLLESILEEIGVCKNNKLVGVHVYHHSKWDQLTLAVGEADGESLLLGLALGDIGGGVPDPAAVAADVGAQLHFRDDCKSALSLMTSKNSGCYSGMLTVVVSADLEGLVAAHDQASLQVLLVLQQTDITSTTLLPLLALGVELEELGAHLEDLLLNLLAGLHLHDLLQLLLHPAGIGNDLDGEKDNVRKTSQSIKRDEMAWAGA